MDETRTSIVRAVSPLQITAPASPLIGGRSVVIIEFACRPLSISRILAALLQPRSASLRPRRRPLAYLPECFEAARVGTISLVDGHRKARTRGFAATAQPSVPRFQVPTLGFEGNSWRQPLLKAPGNPKKPARAM